MSWSGHEHDWATWFDNRCRARTEPKNGVGGRCDLRAEHEGDHAIDRSPDCPHWSTEWTA